MHRERTDEELVAAIARGPGALAEFYRRHIGRITGMGVRRFADPEDVADFVAEVFVEVMRSATGFDPRRGKAVPWLCGLAGNVAADMHRKRFRRHDAENRLAGRLLLDADDYARVEERIDAASQTRLLYAALGRLPDPDRRLLELVAVDGLTPAQVAQALGISAVAARVRLMRSRARLQEAMTLIRTHQLTEEHSR
ncbi:MAG TPA: sigma-70 family RNA polymerase sigma factor [Candidatus Limnocylindrales bacterium]|nr:sigma-70 family RNA polymerase sigma factor [Candidatus Limnocylindrales bacterium]